MCNRVRASFEFREIRGRWDLVNDLPQFKPIYNVSPGRKEADVLAIVRGDPGNEGRLMYWPLIPSHEKSMKLTYSTMNAKVERLRAKATHGEDTWKKPDGGILESFTIITMPPNDFIVPIHDRIPAILHPEDEETWLDCAGSRFDKV
jgi:putative SOS response-associated peptidase YedK